ncbi:MAG: hypothetical protein K5637_01835 [Lachnospiraceae bacterium]|nr:hypothetical protein [Lachnospiraceae bacterium]
MLCKDDFERILLDQWHEDEPIDEDNRPYIPYWAIADADEEPEVGPYCKGMSIFDYPQVEGGF